MNIHNVTYTAIFVKNLSKSSSPISQEMPGNTQKS